MSQTNLHSANWHPTTHISSTHGRQLRWLWSSWVLCPWGWSFPCPGLPHWCGSFLYCCWWCKRGFLDWCCTTLSHFLYCQDPLPTPGQGTDRKKLSEQEGFKTDNVKRKEERNEEMNQRRKKNNSSCSSNGNQNFPISPREHPQTQTLPTVLTHQSAERKMVTSLFWHKVAMGDECVKPGGRLKH